MKARRAERLEAMHERVEARGGRDLRRQADRELRVRDDDARHHLRVENDLLLMRLLVEDDACAPHFGSGAGRGGHRDHRRDAGRIGARPPVADILEIPERARLPGHERDDLAGIEPRTAAEGHDAIVLASAIRLEARLHVGRHGIAAHVGKQSRTGQRRHRLPDHLRIAQAAVRDHERLANAEIGAGRR